MPVRLGQFYAFVLLLVCLVTNIAFFAEVREPFLGDEDPLASVKSAFADLDVPAKIAGFYPKTQSKIDGTNIDGAKADEVLDIVSAPLAPPLEIEKSAPREPIPAPRTERPTPQEPPSASPVIADPMVDPFLPFTQQPSAVHSEEVLEPAHSTVSGNSTVSGSVPERQTQDLKDFLAPTSSVAGILPVVAEQFRPIIVEPKPVAPVKPSSAPVWDTADTIWDRPIWYD